MPERPLLHVGCGDKRLEGWINIDLQSLPGVDVVADVTRGLEFSNAAAVFAEHFIEHLAIDDALQFLVEVRRALAADGVLRLSTPNLDWVWATHYDPAGAPGEKVERAIVVNRAFYAWGHRFLWNREMLAAALEATGFEDVRWCRYGQSEREHLRGLERHETYGDLDDLPHVLVVEASRGPKRRKQLAELRRRIEDDFLAHLGGRYGV